MTGNPPVQRPAGPPEDLVIYEVKGGWNPDDTPEGKPDLGPDFLGFWIESGYTFFFFSASPGDPMDRFLGGRPGLQVRYIHRMKYSQWQDGAGFTPFTVGPLSIFPAWNMTEPASGSASGHRIYIDPGLAFGFGGHPTTLACLRALVRIYREDRPESVLDLGAGTGVLALAAARLGAASLRAVEYSHLAADTARANVSLNGLARSVEVVRGLAEDHAGYPAALVCSNLHFAVQQAVLDAGGFGGRKWLILSGLFHEEADIIQNRLTSLGYGTVDRVRDDRWATLLMKRRQD